MENHVGPTTYCLEAWNMVKLHIQGNQWKVCEITLFFYINIYLYIIHINGWFGQSCLDMAWHILWRPGWNLKRFDCASWEMPNMNMQQILSSSWHIQISPQLFGSAPTLLDHDMLSKLVIVKGTKITSSTTKCHQLNRLSWNLFLVLVFFYIAPFIARIISHWVQAAKGDSILAIGLTTDVAPTSSTSATSTTTSTAFRKRRVRQFWGVWWCMEYLAFFHGKAGGHPGWFLTEIHQLVMYFWWRDIRPKNQPTCVHRWIPSINSRMERSKGQVPKCEHEFLHLILHGFHHRFFKMQASDAMSHCFLTTASFRTLLLEIREEDVIMCLACVCHVMYFRWAGCLSLGQSGQHDFWNLMGRWSSILWQKGINDSTHCTKHCFINIVNICMSQVSYSLLPLHGVTGSQLSSSSWEDTSVCTY